MKTMLLGALLTAAPLFCESLVDPVVKGAKIRWFSLAESPAQVTAALGPPAMVAETGSQWIAWQYRLGDTGHEDFSHQFLFERGTGRLLSVTRNYEFERDVSALFPRSLTSLHHFPNADKPQLTLRLREMNNGLVLTALGASGKTSQVVLLRKELIPLLFPWLR